MNATIRCLAVALALAAAPALAQKDCSSAESQAAEKALDNVVNWELMYKAFKQYGHCDNVLTEDTFTDAFMRIAVQWKDVNRFAANYQSDAQYKAFVHRRMKSISAKDDVKSLYSRAKTNCPPKLEAFCAEIAEVAKAASQ